MSARLTGSLFGILVGAGGAGVGGGRMGFSCHGRRGVIVVTIGGGKS